MNIIVGIYMVFYKNLNMIIGGILFGRVYVELYGFFVGFFVKLINLVIVRFIVYIICF